MFGFEPLVVCLLVTFWVLVWKLPVATAINLHVLAITDFVPNFCKSVRALNP